jgi:hypothetical protein
MDRGYCPSFAIPPVGPDGAGEDGAGMLAGALRLRPPDRLVFFFALFVFALFVFMPFFLRAGAARFTDFFVFLAFAFFRFFAISLHPSGMGSPAR